MPSKTRLPNFEFYSWSLITKGWD